jgi:cytidine deaminase
MEENGLNHEMIEKLCGMAVEMRSRSYVPYSHFRVGAALLAQDGRIFTGCNVENASYSPCSCAERTAFVKAISEGVHDFLAIAISGGLEGGELEFCPPCGVCRQVMSEFCTGRFPIYLAKSKEEYVVHTLDEMLPFRFTVENLHTSVKLQVGKMDEEAEDE